MHRATCHSTLAARANSATGTRLPATSTTGTAKQVYTTGKRRRRDEESATYSNITQGDTTAIGRLSLTHMVI